MAHSIRRHRGLVLVLLAALSGGTLGASGAFTAGVQNAAPGRRHLFGQGLRLPRRSRRHLPRRRHRRTGRGRQLRVIVNDDDVWSWTALSPGAALGAARGAEGADPQAGALRRQHALALGPRARQPDLRPRRRDHRPRVHAPEAGRGRLDARPHSNVHRRPAPPHRRAEVASPRPPTRPNAPAPGAARRPRPSSKARRPSP